MLEVIIESTHSAGIIKVPSLGGIKQFKMYGNLGKFSMTNLFWVEVNIMTPVAD